jgi:hypothetical protein
MGCYGLGLSRILAASVEVLSTEKELRWPDAIVPFTVCIVCPKNGSREAEVVGEKDLQIYDLLVDELNLVSSILRTVNYLCICFMIYFFGIKNFLLTRKCFWCIFSIQNLS